MSLEPGIVDANILVYAMAADAPRHAASRALLDVARDDPATTLYVTSQNPVRILFGCHQPAAGDAGAFNSRRPASYHRPPRVPARIADPRPCR